MKKLLSLALTLLFFSCNTLFSQDLVYQIHEQSTGWSQWYKSNNPVGIDNKRIEGIRIKLVDFPSSTKINYRAHVQGEAWQNWVSDGQLSGTEGQRLRMEALEIKLENAPSGYSICYNVQVGQRDGGSGFMDFGGPSSNCDGKPAGTVGRRRPIERLNIELLYYGQAVNKLKKKSINKNLIARQSLYSKTCDYDVYFSKKGSSCSEMQYAGKIGKNRPDINLSIKGKEEIWIRIYESGVEKCSGSGKVLERHTYIHPFASKSSHLREQISKNNCEISSD